MKKEHILNSFVVERLEEFSPGFIRENAQTIPYLFQVSLLDDLAVRVEKIPDLFLYLVEQITPFDTGLLYVWEPSGVWFCRGIQGEIPAFIERGNLFTHAIRKISKPLLILDVNKTGLASSDLPFPFSSMMGLPIYMDTNTIGCVELYRKGGNPFTLTDVTLIKHLLLYSEKTIRASLGREKDMDEVLDIRMDVPQRHVLMDILHQHVEQAKRLSHTLSIALVAIQDAERFGRYHGVAEGLRTLKALAKRIKDGLRCYDKVVRYEEMSFFVILPGCTSREAITALNNATSRLEADLRENLTIGIATLPDEVQDTKGLINAAHQALSYAKKKGLRIATYFQTGAVKPTNLSLELTMRRFLSAGPSLDALQVFLDLLKIQCQAEEISLRKDPPGSLVNWEDRELGYVYFPGLSEEIFNWFISYLAPAWATAAGLNADKEDWYLSLLTTASILSDIRAGYPMGYSIKVSDQVHSLAREMGKDECESLRWAKSALAANIGYMGIPTSILTKDELNPFDWKKIRSHPIVSARMCKDAFVIDYDADILTYHHEHLDGSGYPRGLKGGEIPVGARALRVVDTFNAMVSPRLYRPQKRQEVALGELQSLSGVSLDPDMTSLYMGIIGS
jgi:diguanylate cyclase (GGDEF)-like protein